MLSTNKSKHFRWNVEGSKSLSHPLVRWSLITTSAKITQPLSSTSINNQITFNTNQLTMMNTSQPSNPPSASLRGPKILNSRRPLQTRSVNTSSSQSPAKTKVRLLPSNPGSFLPINGHIFQIVLVTVYFKYEEPFHPIFEVYIYSELYVIYSK